MLSKIIRSHTYLLRVRCYNETYWYNIIGFSLALYLIIWGFHKNNTVVTKSYFKSLVYYLNYCQKYTMCEKWGLGTKGFQVNLILFSQRQSIYIISNNARLKSLSKYKHGYQTAWISEQPNEYLTLVLLNSGYINKIDLYEVNISTILINHIVFYIEPWTGHSNDSFRNHFKIPPRHRLTAGQYRTASTHLTFR